LVETNRFTALFSVREAKNILCLTSAAVDMAIATVYRGRNKPLTSKLEKQMIGLIGKTKAVPGQREVLIEILIEGSAVIPGCLSYVVPKEQTDQDAIWVTEMWNSRENHAESLSLPSVQKAIEKGKFLIAGFREQFETTPIGGQGLSTKRKL